MAGAACAGAQLPGSALASRPRDRSAPRTAFGRPGWLEHACCRPPHSHGDATPGLARDLGPRRVRRPPALRSLGPAPVALSELQERRRGGRAQFASSGSMGSDLDSASTRLRPPISSDLVHLDRRSDPSTRFWALLRMLLPSVA
ncbi:unnamed protein product [Prorocentrum cordatum]|uniref:Uncharacterized protein n=1 Tax=Prorocentrum cordatum TaxID=2364126 RepID=A0ABN9SFC3_9DINO|nr:unnamed protein product [Polarella glacialis]